jgi:hypothetical protein
MQSRIGTITIFINKGEIDNLLNKKGIPTLASLFYSFLSILNIKNSRCFNLKRNCLDAPIHDILLLYIHKETDLPVEEIDKFFVIDNPNIIQERTTSFRIQNYNAISENYSKLADLVFDNLQYFYEERNIDGLVLENIKKKLNNNLKKVEFLINVAILFFYNIEYSYKRK